MKDKVAICLIIKDEPEMLFEFIDYYLKLGADTIIIYDNDSFIPIKSDNPNVIVIHWVTVWPANQTRAYLDCAKKFKNDFKWIGFFDSDEYLILKKHQNIKDFLADYNYANGVGINWLCFGSSGIEKHNSHADYYKHSDFDNPINTHIKSIIKPEFLIDIPNDPHYLVSNTVDTTGKKITSPFTSFSNGVAYLKHCINRTKENYLKKAARNRADTSDMSQNFRTIQKWEEHELSFNKLTEETKVWM